MKKQMTAWIILIILAVPVGAVDLSQNFSFDGNLLNDASGTPMTGPVAIRFQIVDPVAETCLLYEESHSAVSLATDGSFSLKVGPGGGGVRNSAIDGNLSWKHIFQNSAQVRAHDSSYCPGGYTPSSQHGRRLIVTVNGTPLAPSYAISSVPMATVAETLQGKLPSDFVSSVVDSLISANVTIADQNHLRLEDAGSNYVALRAPAAVPGNYTLTLPATAGSSGQVLTTDGAGVLGWSSPASAGDIEAVNTNAGSALSGGAAAGNITLSVEVDDTSIEVNGSNALQIKDNGVTDAKIAGLSYAKLTGGAGIYLSYRPGGTSCGDGQILKWSGTNTRWECSNENSSVLSVFGRTGVVTAQSDDYVANQITFAPVGDLSATHVQGALAELDGEKLSATTPSMASGNFLMTSENSRLGIGTGSPNANLHISNYSAASLMKLEGNNAVVGFDITNVAAPLTSRILVATSPARLSFQAISAGDEDLVITSAHNVGIGTTNPTEKLEVEGGVAITGAAAIGGNLTVTGTAYGSSANWQVVSDARSKTVSGSYEFGLEQILNIDVVRYNYLPGNRFKFDSSKNHVGVVAQDLQKVIPDAVTRDSKTDYLTVNTAPVFWASINAIQQLHQKIDDKDREIASLHEKTQDLERKNKMMMEWLCRQPQRAEFCP